MPLPLVAQIHTCVQGAAIGNTAFVSSIVVQVGVASTEVRVSIRNNATLPGGAQDYFWAGQTQVFVEFLALSPSNSTFEALPGYEGIDFVHSVWPGVVTEDDLTAGGLRLTCAINLRCTLSKLLGTQHVCKLSVSKLRYALSAAAAGAVAILAGFLSLTSMSVPAMQV